MFLLDEIIVFNFETISKSLLTLLK